ncbi:putative HTH-type transcriptional regulator slr0701 [Planktothrix agardhii]|jgi:MerR family transcriptional regulator, Zn(II)-responsive regulator of zntA|uniref:heavy metal-responsive transcriptional regulator n=1 Tax=Planktothrix agardhii TaxID=1160 RepID=UPI0020A7A353|nr:heavy metal-responsive transcriptional regulator [Planktothrix agardhii]CAD5918158.1 putative HTH-type transcriptional regulator slr0701 [Planktothrix agardhii]
MFQIGAVSRILGLNPQTVYFYERIGLIPPPQRTEAGYRLFSPSDMERLEFIVRAKSLGLSLEEIREILALKDGQLLTCSEVQNRLVNKLEAIEDNIRQLQALREELLPLVARCRHNLDPINPEKQCVVLEENSNQSAD